MPGLFHKHKIPEVFIDGYQNHAVSRSPLQKRPVPRIRAPFARLNNFMSHLSQPLGQTPARTPVEPHGQARGTFQSARGAES